MGVRWQFAEARELVDILQARWAGDIVGFCLLVAIVPVVSLPIVSFFIEIIGSVWI